MIGRVVATPTTPNLERIDLVLNPTDEIQIERGQFLSILENPERTIIGVITSIKKFNAYFETHQASIQDNVSRDFESIFPIEEWEVVLAEVKPLGEFHPSKDKINRIKYPVSPGAKTTLASPSIISRLLGLNENGLYLGNIPQNNVKVQLDTSRLLRKHMAILAISGAGKSYATSILLEELHKLGTTSVLLVDPHGEYGSLLSSWGNSENIEIVKGSYLSICVPELSAWEISEFIPEISPVQTRILEKTLTEIRKEKRLYGLNDIIKWVESSENINTRTKEALVGWLHSLTKTYLFSSKNDLNFEQVMEPGKIVVLDLAEITSVRSRRMLTLYFLKNLYRLRTKNEIPPIVFVIEEAHQFCLSEDTELLTSKGWKKYTEIEVGDLAFSYNRESKKLELAKIQRLIIRNYKGEMVKLFNENSIDALVTKDHRVLCNYRTVGKDRKMRWSNDTFRSANDLPSSIRIPVSAKFTENGKCSIDDDLIKIIGWITTDGHIHYSNKNKNYYSYGITQSEAKESILQEMTKVIKRRYPETSVYVRKRTDEKIDRKPDHNFYFKKKAKKEIDSWILKNAHRIPREILEKADLYQLKLLFNSMVQGDGNIQFSNNGYKYITFYAGKNKGLADDFQELSTKIGLSAIQKLIPQNNQYKVLVSFKRKFSHVRRSTTKFYSGKVWDITINNGAFVARRNGKVFITGNCPQNSASISKWIIETIAREGRKFYASLCLISQRPVNLSVTALSQCNTNLILRIRNPYDLDYIGKTSESIDRSALNFLPSLNIGEALLVGEAINFPIFFQIRKRKLSINDTNPNFETMAENYAKSWTSKVNRTAKQ